MKGNKKELTMSHNVALVFCKEDSDTIKSNVGYTPDTPLEVIHERLKAVIPTMLDKSNLNAQGEWFKDVCDVSCVSAVITNPDGTTEFQFTLLPDKQLPDLPGTIQDAFTETPTDFVATFTPDPITGIPHTRATVDTKKNF